MADEDLANDAQDGGAPAPKPAGQEAPPHPAADPTRKTMATTDPTADDPGNGAD